MTDPLGRSRGPHPAHRGTKDDIAVTPDIGEVVSYKPSVYYWRKQIREARTMQDLRDASFNLCNELELLKAWVREQGMIPPKRIVTKEEAFEKRFEPQFHVVTDRDCSSPSNRHCDVSGDSAS